MINKIIKIIILILSINFANSEQVVNFKLLNSYSNKEIWRLTFDNLLNIEFKLEKHNNRIKISIKNSKFKLQKSIIYSTSKFIKSITNITNNSLYINLQKDSDIYIERMDNNFKITLLPKNSKNINHMIVTIDPGHGGKDSGAIGKFHKIYEKTVVLDISKKLYDLLNKDKRFIPYLTRKNDTFISVLERSNIARKNKSDLLISIHADSSPNISAKGSSIWIISNKRAQTETGRILEADERKSRLLGGLTSILDSTTELDKALIDLQFSNSQRIATNIGNILIKSFIDNKIKIKKNVNYASLGVLRNPDIPSILVETGFLSNKEEETLLKNNLHREKIALSIYKALVNFKANNESLYYNDTVQLVSTITFNRIDIDARKSKIIDINQVDKKSKLIDSGVTHKILNGETLSLISRKYLITIKQLKEFNNLSSDNIKAGFVLKIPKIIVSNERSLYDKKNYNDPIKKKINQIQNINKYMEYKVKKNDSLNTISKHFNISIYELKLINKLKNDIIYINQTIKVYKYSKIPKIIDYKVKDGDSLLKISNKYKISIEYIKLLNNISDNNIKTGQKLHLEIR